VPEHDGRRPRIAHRGEIGVAEPAREHARPHLARAGLGELELVEHRRLTPRRQHEATADEPHARAETSACASITSCSAQAAIASVSAGVARATRAETSRSHSASTSL
jgi:hypothetical protein